jgi:hypothetical protein
VNDAVDHPALGLFANTGGVEEIHESESSDSSTTRPSRGTSAGVLATHSLTLYVVVSLTFAMLLSPTLRSVYEMGVKLVMATSSEK